MNYYAILGVDRGADADAIRRAYRSLARRYHPDAGGSASTEKFREIAAAYETLIDPQRRALYDRSLQPFTARTTPRPGSPFVEWDLLFDEWLRGLFR